MNKTACRFILIIAISFLFSCTTGQSAPSSSQDVNSRGLLSFDFSGVVTKVVISGLDISISVPYGTDAGHLTALFTTNGDKVFVDEIIQSSGVTVNDFSGHDVYYRVVARDGTDRVYRITVTVDPIQLYQNLVDLQYYGTDIRNRYDISLPANRYYNTPVVICIHGGYWVSGSKDDFGEEYRKNFTDRGYACASINYRYANQTSVTYTQIMEDLKRVIENIISMSDAWKLSDKKFALLGFSAGAVNTALYAHGYNDRDLVKIAVCFSGAYDLTDTDLWNSAGKSNLLKFTGDEAHMFDASPKAHLKDVPTLVFHGEFDSLILESHAASFNSAMDALSIRHDYTVLAGEGHSLNFSNPVVLNKIFSWFSLYLD